MPVEVISRFEIVLMEQLRVVVRLADCQARKIVLDGLVEAVERIVRPIEVVVADTNFLHFRLAHHPVPDADDVCRLLRLNGRVRGVAAGSQDERIAPVPPRSADGHAILRGELIVHAREEAFLVVLVRNRERLSRQRRWCGERRARLSLVFVGREIMNLVLDDRPAERPADLLVLVRQHRVREEVGRVQRVVAKEPVEAALRPVRAGARHRLHLDAGGAPLGDVEHVRHELEFANRLAAEFRLAHRAQAIMLLTCWPSRFN